MASDKRRSRLIASLVVFATVCTTMMPCASRAAEAPGLGSYIMSFAGYNAGRVRVQKWVAQYGDPRDANVDAIDWVERIPFSETRN